MVARIHELLVVKGSNWVEVLGWTVLARARGFTGDGFGDGQQPAADDIWANEG